MAGSCLTESRLKFCRKFREVVPLNPKSKVTTVMDKYWQAYLGEVTALPFVQPIQVTGHQEGTQLPRN
jgi:hypothetical protein